MPKQENAIQQEQEAITPTAGLKANRNLDHVPGDYGFPILGHTRELISDFPGHQKRMYDRYGPVFRDSAFLERSVIFLGPEAAQTVLRDRDNNFSSMLGWDSLIGKLFPGGLMLRDFDNHLYHRRIMQVAFRKPAMEIYAKEMNPVVIQGIKDWHQGKKLHFYPAIKVLTLNLAAAIFLGLELGTDAQRVNRAFLDMMAASVAVIRIRIPGLAFWRGFKGREYLSHYFQSLIPEKYAGNATDLLAQLCRAKTENGEQYSNDEIVDHMIFLMMAAHDTTTSALTNMAYELAKHPEWQDQLRDEFKALGKNQLEYDDLPELKTTERVLKEVLRLYPPVGNIPRRTIQECEVEGVRIPANTTVWLSPYFTQRMPEWWTNPNDFDPDRFSDERAEDKKHAFSLMSYGGGDHMCMGLHFSQMQVKVVMFHLLLKHRLRLHPGYEPKYRMLPLPKPKDNLPMIIEPIG